jgi:two-component system, OmpR family, alkaline phosphatase synthesis response regulator PhoP
MSRAKVLIVDDEPNILVSLEFLMEQAGYAVDVARDGDEAMTKIADFRPDLILLDVMVPGTDGFQICRRVRQNPAWAATRILMLTAKGQEADRRKGLGVGADRYVTKPFSTQSLLAEVRSLLPP